MSGTDTSKPHKGILAHLRRRWLLYVIVITVLGVLSGLIRSGVQSINSSDTDGKARDAAVAEYAKQLSDKTKGAIAIDVMTGPNDYTNEYRWAGSNHTLTVTVKLGGCTVDGTFINVANRPTGVKQIGELMLMLPSVNSRVSDAEVSATGPDLYDKVMASALKHCVAGDTRLMPRYDG
ncbi:MAG TPA: hypothetical protein VJM46_00510 [Candidatus Saccharimonadales bacterium]|nr:hypothetical protein [Candidatus Saccharimonadales bacterium]